MNKKIATGIYQTPHGFSAFVRVGQGAGGCRTKRFPRGTKLSAMKAWREDQRVAARQQRQPVPIRGSLAADIERYLELVAAMPTLAWRRRDLYAWRDAFGDLDRAVLTPAMIRAQLHEWRTVGPRLVFEPRSKRYLVRAKPLSASAVNHRRTALLHLYTVLDGPAASNPVNAVPPFQEPPAEPRARDLDFLLAAIARMRNAAQRARALVLLWTGMRGNSELGKMRPEYVDLERAVCHVPTGKGGRRFRTVPLNAAGVAAWREFARLKLWGPYDKNLIRRSFARACAAEAKARGVILPRVRLYDLRHSVATAYLRAGADVADVQELLGHTTSRMTRRYAPYQSDKLRAVGERLESQQRQSAAIVNHRVKSRSKRKKAS